MPVPPLLRGSPPDAEARAAYRRGRRSTKGLRSQRIRHSRHFEITYKMRTAGRIFEKTIRRQGRAIQNIDSGRPTVYNLLLRQPPLRFHPLRMFRGPSGCFASPEDAFSPRDYLETLSLSSSEKRAGTSRFLATDGQQFNASTRALRPPRKF